MKNKLLTFIIMLFILGLCIELCGLIFYYYEEDGFFYTRPTVAENDQPDIKMLLHPYFGYQENKAQKPPEVPFGTDNTYLVGIFGGSFAHQAAMVEERSNILKDGLSQALPDNKRVVVLNMALDGYHQPQQLMVLIYHLARGVKFDLVINIDGFNEILVPLLNIAANKDMAWPIHNVYGNLNTLSQGKNSLENYFKAWRRKELTKKPTPSHRPGFTL